MSEPKPWLIEEAGEAARRHAPATLRNRVAITDVLRRHLPATGLVLEIASGSGEHVVHFAEAMPHLQWQPSDCEPQALRSIAAWSADARLAKVRLANVRPPMLIDVEQPDWPISHADAIVCINMLHISPWSATRSLFRKAAEVLPTHAALFLYGPFIRHDVKTAPGNLEFDASLKARNPEWGLRDVAQVDHLADGCGFIRAALVEMPANNLSLVYCKV